MKRLIAFGCSFTYGHGLPDCFEPPLDPGDEPSKFSWPNTVAHAMNRQCINKSTCGASNKRIWYELTHFNYKPDDIAIVLWSFEDRTCVISKNEIIDYGPWNKGFSDVYDSILMTKLYVNHANFILKSKNIKLYNLILNPSNKVFLTFGEDTVEHIPVYLDQQQGRYPNALDSLHPGKECHDTIAKEILTYLGIDNSIPYHKPYSLFEKIKQKIKRNK